VTYEYCHAQHRLPAAATARHATTTATADSDRPVLHLFNSKTRQKEVFQPMDQSGNSPSVSMYTCGPTVYDYAHVGNFRAFLTYDVLKRVLAYFGYTNVTHVCNLTDVDDKIIQRATELGVTVEDLTQEYTALFFRDLEALNVWPATAYPKATDYIDAMMEIILLLRDKELAYETDDGSWYFRTQAQPGYGQQLVKLDYDEMEQTERGEATGKEHFADFCLWKAFKEGMDREDAAWESKDIRKGRPGWHLECSAMARSFFGDQTIDLHGGGIDLKFPHHENEIAQSEGVLNDYNDDTRSYTPFCNCWFHNGFVNIGDEKMSKSLGNFLTLRGACPTSLEVRAYRYLAVSSQYRNSLAFTPAVLKASQKVLKRLDKVHAQLEEALAGAEIETQPSMLADKSIPKDVANFETALLDDLSTPRAAASFMGVVKAAEQEFKRVAREEDAVLDLVGLRAALDALEKMDRVFGIFYTVPMTAEEEKEEEEKEVGIPRDVLELVAQRSAAKDAKDWDLADSIRRQISELGFAVKDVKGGEPIISRI
jgi:cysteinyl-tRNA synthetase